MSPLFAGIDLGTSGCRIVVIDSAVQVVANASISYQTPEHQTPELWWESVLQLLSGLPDEVKASLQSLAIDGTSGTLLLTDAGGNPTSQALMYHDLRATQEARLIKKVLANENGAQGASGSLARLLWLLKHKRSLKHAHALHQADFILAKLTNQFTLGNTFSDENNCLKLGYDVINQCWPDEMAQFGFPLSLLPRVVPAGTCVSTIDSKVAKRLGLQNDLKMVAGTTDSIAAFIATGANQMGDAVTSLGSTLAIKLMSDKPVFVPEFGVYSHRLNLAGDRTSWLVGGASNSGGNVLLRYFSQQQLDEMTNELHPQQLNDYAYYPLAKQGERFPFADPDKQPVLCPRPDSDVDFMQGILEGIADIEALAYQRLQKLGAPAVTSVRSVGGGSNNSAWTQIRAQKLKVDMIKPKYTEAAYGTALLAKIGIEND